MKKIIGILLSVAFVSSCVTSNKYNDLMSKKVRVESEKAECEQAKTNLEEELADLNKRHVKLDGDFKSLKDEFDQVSRVLTRIKTEYNNLEDLHDRLTSKYNELLSLSNVRTNQLTTDLSSKEKELFSMERRLTDEKAANDKLAGELKAREERVKELESILAEQQKIVNELKSNVSSALLGFSDSDLQVEIKNGKVYVSLAEQLLFKSGSILVDPKGIDALEKLAKALSSQKDLTVVVEGHTDDVPMKKKSEYMKDNWDLSVLRATEIVRILTNNGVNAKQVQAAGKGEFSPVDDANTTAARKKNRRTEIILSPNLDSLFKMLGEKPE